MAGWFMLVGIEYFSLDERVKRREERGRERELDRVALAKVNVQGSGNSALHSKHNKHIFISIYFLYSLARLGEAKKKFRTISSSTSLLFRFPSFLNRTDLCSLFYSFTSCFSSPLDQQPSLLTLSFLQPHLPSSLKTTFFPFRPFFSSTGWTPYPLFFFFFSQPQLLPTQSANNHGLPIKSHFPPPNHRPLHRSSRRCSSPLLFLLLRALSTL